MLKSIPVPTLRGKQVKLEEVANISKFGRSNRIPMITGIKHFEGGGQYIKVGEN